MPLILVKCPNVNGVYFLGDLQISRSSELLCYRGAMRGGVDFDKCLINFVPRSNIKPGYFLT